MDSLESHKTLVKKHFRQSYQKDEVHNVFNEDLLTWCKKPHFKEQHMDLAPLPEIINEEKEYEVEEIRNHRK